MANVWSVQAYAYNNGLPSEFEGETPDIFTKYPPISKAEREARPGLYETPLIRMAPFDVENNQPLFREDECAIQVAMARLVPYEGVDNGARHQLTRIDNIGILISKFIVEAFTESCDANILRVDSILMRIIPDWGTWRPKLILLHDQALLPELHRGLRCQDVSTLKQSIVARTIERRCLAATESTQFVDIMPRVLTCSYCAAPGVSGQEHYQLKRLSRCNRCCVTW